MAIFFAMPKLGMNMTEGHITSWLVKEGMVVKAGQPILARPAALLPAFYTRRARMYLATASWRSFWRKTKLFRKASPP